MFPVISEIDVNQFVLRLTRAQRKRKLLASLSRALMGSLVIAGFIMAVLGFLVTGWLVGYSIIWLYRCLGGS
jgi:type IV secretory pathway TrbD component